jgi:hypothetical protein
MTIIKKVNLKKERIASFRSQETHLIEYYSNVCNIMIAAGCPITELPTAGDIVSYFSLHELYGSYPAERAANMLLRKKLYI